MKLASMFYLKCVHNRTLFLTPDSLLLMCNSVNILSVHTAKLCYLRNPYFGPMKLKFCRGEYFGVVVSNERLRKKMRLACPETFYCGPNFGVTFCKESHLRYMPPGPPPLHLVDFLDFGTCGYHGKKCTSSNFQLSCSFTLLVTASYKMLKLSAKFFTINLF